METIETTGKFIVIEGIDGCGKTTQVGMLKQAIKGPCHFTREATDGPIGKVLRNIYLMGKRKCDERVINMLYAADRFDHVTNKEDGIIKYLSNGVNVISDRFYLSSMAYNTYMMPNEEEVREMIEHTIIMNRYTIETLRPNLTIYIDLHPNVALYRLEQERALTDGLSVYETHDKLTKIHNTYAMAIDILRNEFEDKIIVVNGDQSPEELHANIMTLVNNEFGIS